ncbi:hypothetical protein DPMN_120828 [Dreissena polymorpha]|uniref:Uncharacterized protein n=1 Tax=Dreissena polymorpha TaxID=45954 RepID=A0A9D4JNX9_DREPO|nr:hypothetical protein DPMN_120828 [Dreissena polymorpha]
MRRKKRKSTCQHPQSAQKALTFLCNFLFFHFNECRWSPGIATVHKKTGALPECYRHSPGLRRDITGDDRGETRGVAVALPWSDAGIDTVSAGGVTVYRGSAGTLPAFTGALPATTGAMPGRCRLSPGHYRRQPGLCRGLIGINSSQSGQPGTLPGC